jgi:hypothetical protein
MNVALALSVLLILSSFLILFIVKGILNDRLDAVPAKTFD